MKTIPLDDVMSQIADRDMQEDYEKFVQEGIAQWHKDRAKEKEKEIRSQNTGVGRRKSDIARQIS